MYRRYCPSCRVVVPDELQSCVKCGNDRLACRACHESIPAGTAICPRCYTPPPAPSSKPVPAELVLPEPTSRAEQAIAAIPVGARAQLVPEQYRGGKYGVEADVRIPAGDVAIMNELGKLVELLHAMASRANQFVGQTDHTRMVIRNMRLLATDLQEEIELRRGPLG